MSNEELAARIQQGETACYTPLWEQCRRLLYKILSRYLSGITLPNHIGREDLEQCLYFALQTAVRYYDAHKGYCFNTYLDYSVRCMLRHQLPDKALPEISLYSPLKEDSDTELAEMIEDVAAARYPQDYERRELRQRVRSAVEQLPDEGRQIVTLYYFRNMTQKQITDVTGKSTYEVRAALMRSIRTLREDRELQAMYEEI